MNLQLNKPPCNVLLRELQCFFKLSVGLHFMRSGFSLIELLVVVAIIGILASVGFVTYTLYIDSVRDSVGVSNAQEVNKLLDIDHTAITQGMNARSDMAESFTANTLCKDQVDQVVFDLNTTQGKTATFNQNCGFAFNGNRAWSSTSYLDSTNNVNYFENCPVSVTADSINVPRGRMMVGCVDSAAEINSDDYMLYTCYCGGDESCATTNVADDCLSAPYLGFADEATCRLNWTTHSNNREKCPSPGAFN